MGAETCCWVCFNSKELSTSNRKRRLRHHCCTKKCNTVRIVISCIRIRTEISHLCRPYIFIFVYWLFSRTVGNVPYRGHPVLTKTSESPSLFRTLRHCGGMPDENWMTLTFFFLGSVVWWVYHFAPVFSLCIYLRISQTFPTEMVSVADGLMTCY
jgi:hypothetical protein